MKPSPNLYSRGAIKMRAKNTITHDGRTYSFMAKVERADGTQGRLYHCDEAHADMVVYADDYRWFSDRAVFGWLIPTFIEESAE